MFRDLVRKFVSDSDDPLPNKFTKGMGELVRKAREEAGVSQDQLAKHIFRRRATLSDIENGKVQTSVTTLMLLAFALNKPLAYFFPKPWNPEPLPEGGRMAAEQELLRITRRIDDEDLKVLIAQAHGIAEMRDRENAKDLRAAAKQGEESKKAKSSKR